MLGRKHVRMYACPRLDEGESYVDCGFCLYKPLTKLIHGHSLGILGIDPGSVHPGQDLINLASNLAQKLC